MSRPSIRAKTLFAALTLLATSTAQDGDALEAEIRTLLDRAPEQHPRLFLHDDELPALRAKLGSDAVLRAARDAMLGSAEAILQATPVERVQTGRRLLSVSRTVLKRMTHLGLAWRLTREARFAERARLEMRAAAAFADWNPSHFLDVAEMTAALAIGYDWCHAQLSPADRDLIADAIVRLGLRPSMKGGWWVSTTNNWNQVCHGGLGLGALVTLDRDRELAVAVLARAVRNLPRAMHEYEPDGAYPEGPGYQVYGTSYNVLLLDALQSALDTRDLLDVGSGFRLTPWYYRQVVGPSGLYFNYSDGGARPRIAPAMFWFAREQNRPFFVDHELRLLDDHARTAEPSADQSDRLLPLALIWCPPSRGDSIVDPQWHFQGRTPVALLRSSWQDDATFVGIKAGSPRTNHAHMDAGSFVIDALGTRWAADLGAQSYHSLESRGLSLWNKDPDSDRWKVFRLGTSAHNVLMVDGQQQHVAGVARLVRVVEDRDRPAAILDLSSVYEGQLGSAWRGVELLPSGAVHLQDEVASPDRAVSIRWALLTRAAVEIRRPRRAVLRRDGKERVLSVQTPADVELRVIDTSEPVAAHDAPNPDTRMIVFTLKLAAGDRARLSVLLGGAEDPAPTLRPLADW